MPDALHALVTFVAEHGRCGELDSGKDGDNGYMRLDRSLVRPAAGGQGSGSRGLRMGRVRR